MKIRLIGDGTESLDYNGIRDPDKFKAFILTDLITNYVHRTVSNRFYLKGESDESRSKYNDMIVSISRAIALDYYGSNSGTPADQITKRINNIISTINGSKQKHSSPSTLITENQQTFYQYCFDDSKPQISVRLVQPTRTASTGLLGIFTSGPHAPIWPIVKWIKQDLLSSSRDDSRMQSVLRNQYEIGHRIFDSTKALSEDLMLDLTRTYMALRVVLSQTFQNVGDTFEPVLRIESFQELVPRLPDKIVIKNPVILIITGSLDAFYEMDSLKDIFPNAPTINAISDEVGIGSALYKARLSSNYEPCTIVVLNKSENKSTFTIIQSELEKMRWMPSCTLSISDNSEMVPDGMDVVQITSDSNLIERIKSIREKGMDLQDRRLLSLLKGPYLDILSIGYPSINSSYEHIMHLNSCDELVRTLREFTDNDPLQDCPFAEIVLSVISVICNLDPDYPH